jgi:hypothetical protein
MDLGTAPSLLPPPPTIEYRPKSFRTASPFLDAAIGRVMVQAYGEQPYVRKPQDDLRSG